MKKIGLLFLMAIFMITNLISCGDDNGNQRWATGDTAKARALQLDVDAVQEAFKTAKSPQAFEDEVNKIYTGKEIISLFVQNLGQSKQEVTLYIDNDPENGQMDESEKILKLVREVDKAKNRTAIYREGYGPYGYYTHHSPMYYMATGALLYWAISRPYYTPRARYSVIRQTRTSYRSTPAYKNQVAKTRSFNQNFQKNAPKSFKTTTGKWGGKSKGAGSWGSGTKRAKSTTGSGSSRTRSFSSSSSGK